MPLFLLAIGIDDAFVVVGELEKKTKKGKTFGDSGFTDFSSLNRQDLSQQVGTWSGTV